MPELPDLTVYVEALQRHVVGRVVADIDLRSPFVVRTVEPRLQDLVGLPITGVERIGKRLVLVAGEVFVVVHLMIAGRLRWPAAAPKPARGALLGLAFDGGWLWLTEASSKKRACVHVVSGRAALADFDCGGIDPLTADLDELRHALTRENRTLKRGLTDQSLVAGIGNAYSDEILFAARLSPMKLTSRLTDDEFARLHQAMTQTLSHWIEVLRQNVGTGFPDKVTAFRPQMAVHGRYRQPCRDCGQPIQRIRYADNECNYCARCQNAGRLLADRGLSQLLRADWPKTLEELDQRRQRRPPPG